MIEAVPARTVGRLAAVPAWAWLTGMILASTAGRIVVGRQLPVPFVFIDELTYRDLAAAIADTGLPQIRGVTTYAYSVLYPAVIAPAYALFENQAHAYAAAKAIGALVMSLAAVPTYLLARMLVRPLLALVAAGLALAVPFMGFTSLLMTEVAFYPLVALALYAAVLALNQPTLGHQLLFAVAIVAAVATRRQALVLVAAFVTAIVLLAVLEAARSPRGRRGSELMRTLRVYALTWVLLAGCLVLAVVAQLVRGSGIEGLFGANASAVTSGYSVSGIAGWFVDHLADLDVISGIVPLAALIVLVVRLFRARCNDRVEAAFAAAAVSFVFWMLLAVAAFAERFQPRLEERMLASLLPAVFVALVVWLDRPRRESSVTTASAALIAVLLPVLILHRDALGWSSVENAFGLWPLFRLVEAGSSIGLVATYVMVGAVLLGVLFVLLGRRFLLVLPAILLAYFVVATYDVQGRFERLSLQSSAAGLGLEREWIDDATPENASVAAFWSTENPSASWLNEFFSRKLGQRYSPADDVLDTFSEPLQPDPETGVLVDRVGRPISADYVVTSSSFRFDGTLVAADPRTLVHLYEVGGPLRLIARVQGQYEDGYSAATMIYTRYGCSGGRLLVQLTHSGLIDGPQTVVARIADKAIAGVSIRSKESATLEVPVVSEGGRCVVAFTVSPTLVPDDALGNGDTREVGVRFDSLEYLRA